MSASADDPGRMAVARDHLRGDGGRLQAQARADFFLGFRADVAEGADRAGDFADAQILGGGVRGASRLRVISSYQSASFRPKVMGSAWMPWVRPICDGVLEFEARGA